MSASQRRPVIRWRSDQEPTHDVDDIACEEPLEIRVNGHAVSVTMRTPGHDDELALGFLLTEGILRGPADVAFIGSGSAREDCNVVEVDLANGVALDLDRLTRHVFASSSCGLCGKATIAAVQQQFAPVRSDFGVDVDILRRLPETMRAAQPIFAATGGLHAAALFDERGELLVAREDVGRHNAVDKVLGYAFRAGWTPLEHHILMVSGRASFEILQKALAGRIPIVAAVSAPSSLAIEFAEANGQALIGFLREGGMNEYTRPARLHPPRQDAASR